jgi:membrane protein
MASGYGAAGSVMILLLWVYYSCQILLLGAEFTRVYAEHGGATFELHVFAERARRTQSGDTRNRLDVTQPASADT